MRLAGNVGLPTLADAQLNVLPDKSANTGAKVTSEVAEVTDGADLTDDTALQRHGGTNTIFTSRYAPSTVGSFLRQLTFGYVRQLDALADRMVTGLNALAPLLRTTAEQ